VSTPPQTSLLYLLDTNVVSEMRKKVPAPSVIAFLRNQNPTSVYLSVLTLGELHRGAVKKRASNPAVGDALSAWVFELEQTFDGRIFPVNASTARVWGEITAGRTLPVADALIAATAIVHNLTLVTRNTKDVHDLPVRLLNPWQP
jgi:toxin FitB